MKTELMQATLAAAEMLIYSNSAPPDRRAVEGKLRALGYNAVSYPSYGDRVQIAFAALDTLCQALGVAAERLPSVQLRGRLPTSFHTADELAEAAQAVYDELLWDRTVPGYPALVEIVDAR